MSIDPTAKHHQEILDWLSAALTDPDIWNVELLQDPDDAGTWFVKSTKTISPAWEVKAMSQADLDNINRRYDDGEGLDAPYDEDDGGTVDVTFNEGSINVNIDNSCPCEDCQEFARDLASLPVANVDYEDGEDPLDHEPTAVEILRQKLDERRAARVEREIDKAYGRINEVVAEFVGKLIDDVEFTPTDKDTALPGFSGTSWDNEQTIEFEVVNPDPSFISMVFGPSINDKGDPKPVLTPEQWDRLYENVEKAEAEDKERYLAKSREYVIKKVEDKRREQEDTVAALYGIQNDADDDDEDYSCPCCEQLDDDDEDM